jgi:hypothetical protein
LRKDDTNFFLIGKLSIDVLNFVRIFVSNDLLFLDSKLYYVGKSKTDKRLVILDKEGTRQVFENCHGRTEGRPPLRKAATNFSFIGKLSIGVLNFVKIFVSMIFCF